MVNLATQSQLMRETAEVAPFDRHIRQWQGDLQV